MKKITKTAEIKAMTEVMEMTKMLEMTENKTGRMTETTAIL